MSVQKSSSLETIFNSPSSPKRRRSARLSEMSGSSLSSSSSEEEVQYDTDTSSEGPSKRRRKDPHPKRSVDAEIDYQRKSTELLIPCAPFRRLVREITLKEKPDAYISNKAFEALQESVEMYMVSMFEDALLMTAHRQRVTLNLKDIILAQHMRGDWKFFILN